MPKLIVTHMTKLSCRPGCVAACLLVLCGCGTKTLQANMRTGAAIKTVSVNDLKASAPAQASDALAKPDPADAKLGFLRDIKPITDKYCSGCHSSQIHSGDVALDVYADDASGTGALAKWQVVVASLLSKSMPPAGNSVPTDVEIATIKAWVEAGAPLNDKLVASCDPGERAPAIAPIRRLTRTEYVNTLTDLVGADILAKVNDQLAAIPEESGAQFDSMNLSVTPEHVAAYFDVADKLADVITGNNSYLDRILPCLRSANTTALTDTCIASFLDGFARKSFRRPLTATEKTNYTAVFAAGKAVSPAFGLDLMLSALLQSSQLLYLAPTDGQQTGFNHVLQLTPYELASRLSYLLWQSMPDDALFDAAAAGNLGDNAVFKAQVERMLASPKARSTLATFYKQWLGYEDLPYIQPSPGHTAQYSSQQVYSLMASMKAEIDGLTDWLTFDQNGSFQDLLTTDAAFVTGPELAALYGVSVPSDPKLPVMLPESQRSGILARAGMLYTLANGSGSPILRGAHIRQRFLCDKFVQPAFTNDQQIHINQALNDAKKSTRDKISDLTLTGTCESCHKFIDATGFSTLNYDVIGRFSSVEQLYDSSSKPTGTPFTIDASVDPAIDNLGEKKVTGLIAYEKSMLDSVKAPNCFALQLYRFSAANEPDETNTCVLNDMQEAVKSKKSVLDVIRQFVYAPEFKMRHY